ncbi:MAG: hypothetical protein NTZ64_09805 [Polaromonas sp.]|nr:hypothetical protein [Polaromonas sp.]
MDDSTLMPGNGASGGLGGMGLAGADSRGKIDGAADSTHEAVGHLSSTVHKTVDKLADGAARAMDKLSSQHQWIKEAPPRALASSKSWIQDKPLETVGIALAVGYAVGRLLRH